MSQLPKSQMRSVDEARMSMEGQPNAGGTQRRYDNGTVFYDQAPLTEYPRMMYRKTEVEDYQQQTDKNAKCGETGLVVNLFDGLLCDTRIANTADEAEALASEGWEITPKAAHGLDSGIAVVTTAKDDRIAELERMLAEANSGNEAPRRGRPPKALTEPQEELNQ